MGHGWLAQGGGQVFDRATSGPEGNAVVVAVLPDLVAVAHRVVGLLEEVDVDIDHPRIAHPRILPLSGLTANGNRSEFTERLHRPYVVETNWPETARQGMVR